MSKDLDEAKYIAFVSHRRNGSPVSTPVWVVPSKKGTPVHRGRAVLLGDADVARVQSAVRSKYPIMYKLLIDRSDKKAERANGNRTAGTAAIKVVLDG